MFDKKLLIFGVEFFKMASLDPVRRFEINIVDENDSLSQALFGIWLAPVDVDVAGESILAR